MDAISVTEAEEKRGAPQEIELSIVMPCLNEALTVGICIDKAMSFLQRTGIAAEVIVADNGSTDGSQRIAEEHGARVVAVASKGYGSALRGGIEAARGKFVIMGDADDSYDFSRLDEFVEALRNEADLVMGNRFQGGIDPGAMPLHHRYLGNPVLSGIGRLLFGSGSQDFHCGLRGFSREAILSLNLRTTGMEFASEMIVKASLHGLMIAEVPTTLRKDGRDRPPHLRSWRDGWRHLRFLLLYSPRWLFFYPGLSLVALGTIVGIALLFEPLSIGPAILSQNTLLYCAAAIILGLQLISFAVFTRVFAAHAGLLPLSDPVERFERFATLERGALTGSGVVLLGIAGTLWGLSIWSSAGFGPLDAAQIARITIPSVTALAVGLQVIFGSFFLSMLQIGRADAPTYRRRVGPSKSA